MDDVLDDDADVAALQRAAARRCSRPSRWCSRRSGIYSVLSYIVRGRSREIGIRTALGARTGDVLRLVVLEGMTPALIGIAVGAVAALAASDGCSRGWSSASARRIR